jgi:trehalose/maltose transport system substrate-binding protein
MELVLLKEAIDQWIKKTGNRHKVEIITLPHASNECFALYKQWLSAESFDVDVLQMDAPWIGVFADYLTDLTEFYKERKTDDGDPINDEEEIDVSDYFEAVRKNMYSNGKMVALPLYTDCGIIFYRTDLLSKYGRPIPVTWQELYQTAEYIQNEERKVPEKKNKFYGFVFQAKAFEILTCNFIEVLDSFGGSLINNGQATINSQTAVDATLFLINCLKNISSKSVLNYSEEDARGMFQSGNAVFMRNWPYAWSLLNDPSTMVAGKVGVIAIPPSAKGGKSSGVLGGWSMTVSKYSKHKKYAADLIKFLTSKSQQRLWAKHSYAPAFKSLFEDPEVLKNNPFFAYLYDSLQNSVARPSLYFGKNYPRASTEIFNAINGILAESIESDISPSIVKKRLDRLNKKLNEILKKTNKSEIPSEGNQGVLLFIKKFLGFET